MVIRNASSAPNSYGTKFVFVFHSEFSSMGKGSGFITFIIFKNIVETSNILSSNKIIPYRRMQIITDYKNSCKCKNQTQNNLVSTV